MSVFDVPLHTAFEQVDVLLDNKTGRGVTSLFDVQLDRRCLRARRYVCD